MSKIYLRDVGSHPERDLEVALFPDGELQFEADNGKYVHINIAREGVKELLDFLLDESGLESFHPRAMKLMRKKKKFIVIADDEPYFLKAYQMIRNNEQREGTWTEEDERIFQSTMPKVPQV